MATVYIYSSLNMNSASVFYGTVLVANASEIVISDGVDETIYSGSFGYDPTRSIYGAELVYGTLTGITEYHLGSPVYQATGLAIDATTAEYYIQSGNPLPLLELALAGNDQFLIEAPGHACHQLLWWIQHPLRMGRLDELRLR